MDKKTDRIEKYKVAIELLRFEGEMLWKILSSYMIVNTIILGFIAQVTFEKIDKVVFSYYPICFIAGILGIILIFPWVGTFLRNSDYYHLRMAQAKKAEPKEWKLLKGKGEKFAEGGRVKILNESYQISCLGKLMRNKRAVYILVGIFGLIYLSLIVVFGPWWCK